VLREANDRNHIANALINLGTFELDRAALAAATRCYHESLTILQEGGQPEYGRLPGWRGLCIQDSRTVKKGTATRWRHDDDARPGRRPPVGLVSADHPPTAGRHGNCCGNRRPAAVRCVPDGG